MVILGARDSLAYGAGSTAAAAARTAGEAGGCAGGWARTPQARTPLQLQGAHGKLLINTNRFRGAGQCEVQPMACLWCPAELTPDLLQVDVQTLNSVQALPQQQRLSSGCNCSSHDGSADPRSASGRGWLDTILARLAGSAMLTSVPFAPQAISWGGG